MVVVHLRRPITLIGLFFVAAVLVVAIGGRGGASATAGSDESPSDAPVAGNRAPPVSGSAQALVERGVRAFEIGRYDDAIAFYEAALRREPSSAAVYNLMGVAYRHRFATLRVVRDRERAIESFRQAARLDPGYVPALVNLGVTLYQDGRLDEAGQVLARALVLDPDHPDRVQLARMAGIGQ
jgi:tetratricopeptide (TPR) repeat protein